MFVSDILEDLGEALGTCIDARAYRRLTDAVRLLTRRNLFDQVIGEISVCVCGHYVTLPPEVHVPIAIQVDSKAAMIRDEWFTYHINGPGDEGFTDFNYADVLGKYYCTIRDPDRPVKLVAKIHDPADANKRFRVFGYAENGERILTPNANSVKTDGFDLPLVYNRLLPRADVPPLVSFVRVQKEITNDVVELFAVDPTTNAVISKLGHYMPRETTPQYTRIRVPHSNVVRIRFRRRDDELRESGDWINCDNREAILLAVRAVKTRLDGQLDVAQGYEDTAVRLLRQEADADEVKGMKPPQVAVNAEGCRQGTEGLFY